MVDYTQFVESLPQRDVEKLKNKSFRQLPDNHFPYWLEAAESLFLINDWDYQRTSSKPRPDPLAGEGAGDCQDQTMALAVMIANVTDLPFRFVRVESSTGAHVLLEVAFPRNPDRVAEVIRDFHELFENYRPSRISWEIADGHHWFIADPVMGDYIGDISGLKHSGFINDKRGDDWEWYHLNDYQRYR
jgi:hypothetical protein